MIYIFNIAYILNIVHILKFYKRGDFLINYKPFWETLKKKNISTYYLIYKKKIPNSTIARIRHDKAITTTTLNDLCNVLNCDVQDIIKYEKDV